MNAKKTNPYLGQECRIVRAYLNLQGRQSYALKTADQTVAISADIFHVCASNLIKTPHGKRSAFYLNYFAVDAGVNRLRAHARAKEAKRSWAKFSRVLRNLNRNSPSPSIASVGIVSSGSRRCWIGSHHSVKFIGLRRFGRAK